MRKEEIIVNDEVVAIALYARDIAPGVHFYSDDDNSLQLGKQLRAKGEKIKPHKHLSVPIDRKETLQEVLYIEKGQVKISFYDDQWQEVESRALNRGDMILLMTGGHGFEFLEETVMIEVKQGPYNPDSTQKYEGKNT